ncbi:MAG: hypothetical protein L3J96_08130 [Thermoplasmata archaeon]|nr:hypothetical protein [Thermoplasmata archaeon]
MVTPALLPVLVPLVLYYVPVMTVVAALGAWLAMSRYDWPAWSIWPSVAVGEAFAGFLIWVSFAAITNFGIILTDGGVLYLERTPRGSVIQHGVPWDSLHDPTVTRRGTFGAAVIQSLEVELHLDKGQTRAVLTDSRCPLSGALPRDVASWIALPARR